MRSARRQGTPYRVHVMATGDFYDFKTAAKTLVRNRNKDDDGNNISWLRVKWFRYDPNENVAVLFKYDYDDEFRRMPATTTVGHRRKLKQQRITCHVSNANMVTEAYTNPRC